MKRVHHPETKQAKQAAQAILNDLPFFPCGLDMSLIPVTAKADIRKVVALMKKYLTAGCGCCPVLHQPLEPMARSKR